MPVEEGEGKIPQDAGPARKSPRRQSCSEGFYLYQHWTWFLRKLGDMKLYIPINLKSTNYLDPLLPVTAAFKEKKPAVNDKEQERSPFI
jgi:hypothetical protein